jgi:hypothetical protein
MAAWTAATVCDGLVGVDVLVELRAIEEVRHELDNMGIWVELPTGTISWIFASLILELRRSFSTGSRVPWKRSWQSLLKRAWVSEV